MLSKEIIIAERQTLFDCNKGSEAGLKFRAISMWCPLRFCTGSWDIGGDKAVCQALAEYLVVTILELCGQREGHNSIDFLFLHLQFLTSLAVTHRCNSGIKDKKMPSEKLLQSQFRVPPSLSAILSERLGLFCFPLFLHYGPHSLLFLPRFLWG